MKSSELPFCALFTNARRLLMSSGVTTTKQGSTFMSTMVSADPSCGASVRAIEMALPSPCMLSTMFVCGEVMP